jgi:DNA-binding CsgD family transcriptional regulator
MSGSGLAHDAEVLYEREGDLEAVSALLEMARSGRGAGLLIEGPAGIGKSALVRAGVRAAHERNMLVLFAHASPLEQAFAFGVVRDLFDQRPAAAERPGAAGSGRPAAIDLYTRLHTLYWDLVERSAERAVLVAVDDLQWADEESRRFLAYLARRLDGVAISLLASCRVGEGERVSELEEARSVRVWEPATLSEQGVMQLAAGRLGRRPSSAAVAQWHRASGGNPFLVGEVIAAAEEGTGDQVPRTIEREVQRRLARLGEDATSLAQASAILGTKASLQLSAALAGKTPPVAGRAADRLVEARLWTSAAEARFVHSIVADAVLASIPGAELSQRRHRAARLLEAAGADPQHIAAQLLETHPQDDAWAATALMTAGLAALEEGAPRTASSYLRRALEEPISAERRPALLLALGRAEAATRDQHAPEHLQAAIELLGDPVDRIRASQQLALDLRLRGRVPEAADALLDALTDVPETATDLRLELEAQLAGIALGARETLRLAPTGLSERMRHLAGRTSGERMLLAISAFRTGMAGGPETAAAVEAARRALSKGLLADVSPAHQLFVMSLAVLYLTDHIAHAEYWAAEGIAASQRAGSVAGYALTSCFRAQSRRLAGRLADAEADARAALTPGDPLAWPMATTALAFLVDSLVDQGRLDDAQDAMNENQVPHQALETYPLCQIRLARGKLAVARGDYEDGLSDILSAGEVFSAWGVLSPAWSDWRLAAARTLRLAGRLSEADEVARENLELSRACAVDRAVGEAELECALITRDANAARAAVARLSRAEAMLAHVRGLVELGELLLHQRRRAEAGETLREGLEAADHCGAGHFVVRARSGLAALGFRPRRAARRGVDALTAQERRVVDMAARGLSNREIAQALFVTPGTIEAHLTRAYEKLGVRSRAELPRILGLEDQTAA